MTTRDGISQTSWTMSYEGESFEDGSIGALELADALRALQSLVVRCNALTNDPETPPLLRIRTQPPASFEFLSDLSVYTAAAPLIADVRLTADALRAVIFGARGALGVLGLIAALRGRIASNTERQGDSIIVEETADYKRTIVPLRTFELADDRDVRVYAAGVFAPLRGNGNNRLVIRDGSDDLFSMSGNDIDTFEYNDVGTNGDRDMELPVQSLRVVAVNLVNRNARWRFSDGDRTDYYYIRDEEFLDRVMNGEERFGKGDILICRVVQTQYTRSNGQVAARYNVIRVLEHQQPAVQAPLFEDTP